MVSSAKAFSKRKGSKRIPQSRSPNASDHTNHSNATLQASPPSTEFGFQQIPRKPSRSQHPIYFVSPTVYLTGPLELDDADYQVYLNATDRERRASETHYSNPAQRIAFVSDDWIERIIEPTSNVLSEAGAPTSGSLKSNSSPDLQPVSPRVRSPHTLGLIDELTNTMDALYLGPVTQPSSPSLEQGVTSNVHTSRDSQTLSLSPALSLTSQSSENSLGSVGYKTALTQLRDDLRPLTSLLTNDHRCQGCDVVLLKPSSISFASAAPPYLQELRTSTPCGLDYVLLVCPHCLQPYCEGCGERIGVPDRGGTWFRAAMDCCKDVGLKGLLNVLSDLDCSDGSHPRIAALLQIINSSFVNSRQPVHSLTGPVIKCSKLLKLMDEMFHAFMLDDVPLDSDAWRVYEQMVALLRTFTCDSQLKLLIQMDTYIFNHNADLTRCWIRDGLQEDWDHGLPTLVSLRRRMPLIQKILQKYQGRGMVEATGSPHKRVAIVFLKAIQAEWKEM